MIYTWLIFSLALWLRVSAAETHTFNFTTGWVTAKPDGVIEKKMIGFNGEWPLPDIHVKKGDRVQIYLTNGFTDMPTSLHFHGLKHNTTVGNSVSMDGAGMLTQCPIMPGQTYLYNFTVNDQVGTYWYHSHSGAQYADGMRGAFIVHDDDPPFDFDEEMTIMLGDIYKQAYYDVSKQFLSRYNPTGAEPVPQNLLFNNTLNATIDFATNKKYMLRFINGAFFVSQYLFIEGHSFTIVEVDGVYVEPVVTESLYLASGQRMSVLVDSKDNISRNYEIIQYMDKDMLDNPSDSIISRRTHLIRYNPDEPWIDYRKDRNFRNATNEFSLTNYNKVELYQNYDRQVVLDIRMEMLEDGITYMFFNNITFTAPKVPPLTTVLTAGKFATDPRIYGNVDAVVLEHNEIVEIVLNNHDDGAHPFHLHGHNFQVVQKSSSFDVAPVPYNESNPLVPFPKYPVIRDTAVVEPYGHLVLRFRADNPGVWVFHCHVNWHLEQGLATLFIEAPEMLQTSEVLSDNYKQVCEAAHMPLSGNAAGNSDDWLDLTGAPTQPGPLPNGFTLKGYIALLLTSLFGIAGIYTIMQFGLDDQRQDDDELHEKLLALLKANDL